MAFLNAILIYGAFSFLALREGCCNYVAQPECFQSCPDTSISANSSEPYIRKNYEGILSAKVWDTGAIVPQTPLLEELRDVLLEMAANDSIYFSRIVFMHAVWSSALLAVPDVYPSMCPLAKVINDSVAFNKSQNENMFLQTFYKVSGTVHDACNFLTYASLTQTGCADLSDPPQSPRSCYGDGLVFNANEAWNLFGGRAPRKLADIFFKLYNSKVFLERAHAVILAVMMTPAHIRLFFDHPPALVFETVEIFVESPDASPSCCDCMKSRLDELCFLHTRAIYANTTIEVPVIDGEN